MSASLNSLNAEFSTELTQRVLTGYHYQIFLNLPKLDGGSSAGADDPRSPFHRSTSCTKPFCAVVPSLFQVPATLLSCELFKGNLNPDAQDPEQESLQPLISRTVVVRVVALCIQPYFPFSPAAGSKPRGLI